MSSLRRTLSLALLAIACALPATTRAQIGLGQQWLTLQLNSVDEIWSGSFREPGGVFDDHSAFTDLARYNDDLFVTFRESTGHVPGTNGRAAVLRSTDEGQTWSRVADLRKEDFPAYDLRDAKLTVTPTGDLLVYTAGANYTQGSPADRRVYASTYDEVNDSFGPLVEMLPTAGSQFQETQSDWLWRMTWHNEVAYGIGYRASDQDSSRESYLYSSTDGLNWDTVTEVVNPDNRVGETTIRFDDAGDMYLFARGRFLQSGEPNNLAWLGHATAASGYTDFDWTPLIDQQGIHRQLGGPNMIFTPSGEILVASRKVSSEGTSDNQSKTMLAQITVDGTWRDLMELPSGGDTSYAGLLLEGDDLMVSYYSAPPSGGDPHIYFANLTLGTIAPPPQWNGLVGDINQDGILFGDGTGSVETDDISAFVASFGMRNLPGLEDQYTSYLHGDVNFDGRTNMLDFGIVRYAWLEEGLNVAAVFGSATSVPEPSCLALFAIVGAATLLRRTL
ncbi:sialidase family protein [Aeoliella sp.]|uniref:sialidase family protein n=1 Tax=Aeoliella sp. TaxID=2795800 RepID=UPI003CCBEB40